TLAAEEDRYLREVHQSTLRSSEKVVERAMLRIMLTTLAVEITAKQLGGIPREAHELDAVPMTTLAECAGLLPQAPRGPVQQLRSRGRRTRRGRVLRILPAVPSQRRDHRPELAPGASDHQRSTVSSRRRPVYSSCPRTGHVSAAQPRRCGRASVAH